MPQGFIKIWDTKDRDLLKAVHYVLDTGVMSRYINATTLALIPKCKNPSFILDFRPISCCDTIYKCISKLSDLISPFLFVIFMDVLSELLHNAIIRSNLSSKRMLIRLIRTIYVLLPTYLCFVMVMLHQSRFSYKLLIDFTRMLGYVQTLEKVLATY